MSKAERTRKFIIEKSAELFNTHGIAGTAISDIMHATKLAKGGIYGNFESKNEICQEAFFHLTTKLSNELDGAVSSGKGAKEKFFNLLKAYENSNSTPGGCPILNFGVETDDTDPKIRIFVERAIKLSQKRIANIIIEGVGNGEISSRINAGNFSVKVLAMIEGAILFKKVQNDNTQMEIVMEAIQNDFEAYVL